MQRPHNQRLESLKGTPLEYISIEIIQECCEILINIFPEMCIVHPALNSFPDMIRKEDKLVLNAIVALCARYISRSAEESRKLSNSCVDFILQQSANQVFLEPSIPLIKALLLVSLSAWGEGKDYLSWMIHGMASRMLQYVHYAQKDNVISSKNRNSVNPASNTSTANLSVPDGDKNAHKNDPAIDPHSENDGVARTLEDELRVRTQWAGSIMDILISSGKDRPRAFQKCYIDSIPLPCNDEDFLFAFMDTTGTIKGPSMYMTDTHRVKNHQFRNYYLHKIFHIWGRTTAWITSGGRHKPGELKPWDKNSNWYTLTKELRDFKRELPMRLKFSKASFHAFKAQNLAVIIGMINLTEFVCSAGLHREYLPFFPFAMSGPQGPNVAPLFTDSPPPDKDFWIKSAQVLFESCRNIAHLINFYKLNKVPIYTPFVGYCAFTSSVMCYYASVFPFMDPAQQFSSLYLQNLSNDMTQYLTETSRYWNIARSWYQAAMRIRKLYYDIAMQKDKVTSLSRQAYIKFEKLIENIEHSNLSNDNDSDKADNSIAGHTRTGSKGSHLSENHANQPYPQQSNKSAHNNNNIRSQSLNIPEIPSVNTTPTLLPLTPEFLRSSSSLNDYRRGSFSDHGYAIISGANNYISDSSVTNQELNQFNQSTGELASHFRSQSEVSNAFEKKVTHSPPIQPLGSACSISLSTGVFGQSNESTVFNELFSDFRSLDDFGIISGTDDSSIQYSLTSMLAAIGAWDSAGNSSSNSDMSSSFIQSGVVETDKSSLDHSSSSDDILVKTTIVEPAI
ncbi:hypothetical protein NADFUDRAFT_81083 [Nadsonia fulvescens var. elongata DSM 6958]|uniref:Xylanolytic transcriptional activator regulatory domain-containing protein n=1 Tax=Nadsonia fulvescens var. elongata DSM 6958 TaxID=857566 RepID=A0A1E3PRC3_9ASCO|nr:hypothetical protein NADFUDRAFT_81083 [Nadsonia fulvescens var. elongata DSM 6958]